MIFSRNTAMTFKKITLFAFLLTAFTLTAQEDDLSKYDLHPCGTLPAKDAWFDAYGEGKFSVPERADDTLYAGVQIHLLARDNGSGRFPAENLLNSFCRLNEDFGPAAIRFFFKNEWNLIDKSAWYEHDTVTLGIQMMFTNNVPDVLNTYFMRFPAGTCGYNLPYAGVAIGHSCAGPNDHTWTHEVGHALSIQHPFIGWEDKVYNINTPTPDTLTYDYTHFHSTPDTVNAPLDTALVEYLDGRNCGIAADKICDTKPDYLSYRWNCNGAGMSVVQQKDPSGASFFSDGSLYMSYADDACQNRFTPEQIQIMRAKLLTDKAAWLSPTPQGAPISDVPELVSPLNGQMAAANHIEFHWRPVAGATHYLVQGSRVSSLSAKEFEYVTTDTTLTVTSGLFANFNYYWRVRPFNAAYACTGYSAVGKFFTAVSNVGTAQEAGWRVYPTLLASGHALTLEVPEAWRQQSATFRVFSSAGRLVWENKRQAINEKETLDVPSSSWPKGLYVLVCSGSAGVFRETIIVQGE